VGKVVDSRLFLSYSGFFHRTVRFCTVFFCDIFSGCTFCCTLCLRVVYIWECVASSIEISVHVLYHVTEESSHKDFMNRGRGRDNVALYQVLNRRRLFLYISLRFSHNLYLNSSFFLSVTSANSISVLCPEPLSLATLSLLLFSHW
jgi:hypothetical protein